MSTTDDPFSDYESLRSYLENLPMTWYPDLIRAMVMAAYNKKVFLPSGASRLIHNFEVKEGFHKSLEGIKFNVVKSWACEPTQIFCGSDAYEFINELLEKVGVINV